MDTGKMILDKKYLTGSNSAFCKYSLRFFLYWLVLILSKALQITIKQEEITK